MQFIYTVWLRDRSLPPDDQDYEWPACFIVDAVSPSAAHEWGDHLAQQYANTRRLGFVSSRTEAVGETDLMGVEKLPVVLHGQDAADKEIGW